jgi:mannose/cellobiose epimerase-like protein (N-acyl-D-glucosamine 2-epimerase family)
MKQLSSNAEMHRFLLGIEAALKRQGWLDLAEVVSFASRHAAGMSTEFLGEARIALREVFSRGANFLDEEDRRNVAVVLKQLDEALDRRS